MNAALFRARILSRDRQGRRRRWSTSRPDPRRERRAAGAPPTARRRRSNDGEEGRRRVVASVVWESHLIARDAAGRVSSPARVSRLTRDVARSNAVWRAQMIERAAAPDGAAGVAAARRGARPDPRLARGGRGVRLWNDEGRAGARARGMTSPTLKIPLARRRQERSVGRLERRVQTKARDREAGDCNVDAIVARRAASSSRGSGSPSW